jgi:anaphase-promoting complex subunit 6
MFVSRVLNTDPHHPDAVLIYIACLMELKEVNELFRVAHDMVDRRPEESVTWYAVGCYYYLVDKLEPARRYLMKALRLDKYNGAAWLMYGHAFAVDSEHDQSMSAYYKAHHIMRG